MPHINHRRGDTRRRAGQKNLRGCFFGYWNRYASRFYRAAIHQELNKLKARGFDLEAVEDVTWPVMNEIDDVWNYD